VNADQIGIFVNALQDDGHNLYSYSGRGMYGKQCIAVDIDGGVASFMFKLGLLLGETSPEEVDAFTDLTICTDSMGRGSVVYFPSLEWKDAYAD
jgi:hypothetical protein